MTQDELRVAVLRYYWNQCGLTWDEAAVARDKAMACIYSITADHFERKAGMSTNDVPGAVKANADVLAMGCWAEAADPKDKSLILVEGNENGRVIYSMFDLDRDLEYRDGMHEQDFKIFFSWKDGKTGPKWTWHDKTPFPWDKVLKTVKDGVRHSSAGALMTAADKVRAALGLKGKKLDRDRLADRGTRSVEGEEVAMSIARRLRKGIDAFLGSDTEAE